ncbi:MAG: ABC transporter ATP-binding protein [Desulfoplanes sp.]
MSPCIHINHLKFSFADKPLLHDINCTFPGGKWTCLLGPSGCGKSTLLRLISGSLPCAQGTIFIPHEAQRKVAWMAQNDLLLPWMNVLDNVCLGHKLRGEMHVAIRSRALTLLEQAGLGEQANTLPDHLSGGMRQRVALLRTLMEDCPVILMDEPFSRLDALTRLTLQDLAAELLKDRTVLLVTHDPLEALRLGHEVHVLSGTPATLRAPFIPPGFPPRDIGRPEVAALQSELIQRLRQEGGL